MMAKLEDAISFLYKVVLGGAFGSKALEQRKDWLGERSIACGEEHLSGGERGAALNVILDHSAKSGQDLFRLGVNVFEKVYSSQDPHEDVIAGRGRPSSETDEADENRRIVRFLPMREDCVDLFLKWIRLMRLMCLLHETH